MCLKPLKLIVAVVLIQLVFVGCGSKPQLKVTMAEGSVIVDAQTLGEYPTTVSRLRVTEATNGPTVWEIRAKQGTPQIHKLTFVVGVNSASLAHPDSGEYEIIVPKEGSNFILEEGTNYRIEMWGASDQGEPTTADFRLVH